MIYCHAFFNHSNVISFPFQNFTTCCHLKCSWWSWGCPFGLKKPTVGKPRKPSPGSQSAHDKRVVSVKKVSLTWLSQTSGNLTRDVPHFLDSSKSQIRTLHESITSALRLQVTYFATAVGYRYLASRKSQRSPFLLSTATQVTSSMVMEDSAMLVAKITWTQCNECQYPNQGSCWNGLEGNTVSANYHVAAAWYQVHPRHSKNVGFLRFLTVSYTNLPGRSVFCPILTLAIPAGAGWKASICASFGTWDAMGWDPWKNWPLSSYTTWPFCWLTVENGGT